MRCTGSGGTNNGRSSATRNFSCVIDRSQPIRSAITVAGIRGNAASSSRISGSNASTAHDVGARRYAGGDSARSADRTVLRDTPIRRVISLIDRPSAR